MKRINIFLLITFAILSLIGISHHEIWLDEAHHYLFARDSASVSELLYNMRYDGHPILWNLILFGITRFTQNVVFMQLSNVVIAALAVALFLYYSPFSLVEKILFVSGYFVLYEYTVISRNYSLFMLFFFLSLVFYQKKNYIGFGFSLAILANTHLFGLSVASCLLGACALALITKKEKITRDEIVCVLIFLIGALISSWQIIPPADSIYLTNTQRAPALDRLARTSAVFLKGFLPVPDVTNYHFWNTNVLMSISKPGCVFLSLILFLTPALVFRRRLWLLLFFYSNALAMLLFLYFADLNAARYYGVIYLTLVSCFWLERYSTSSSPVIFRYVNFKRDYSNMFFAGLLIVQAVAGVVAYSLDLMRPFSQSKNASQLMLKNKEVIDYVSAGCGAAPVSVYLEKKIFFLNARKYGSFCVFNSAGSTEVENEPQLKSDALAFVRHSHRPAFLITHIRLILSEADSKNIRLLQAFDRSVLRNEAYYIYIVNL